MTSTKNISIKVPVLARVEGEGALEIDVVNDEVTNLKLKIFEPPRYFEKLLEGREYNEVIDIVARICGICPVAYQMSAVHAIESVFQTQPPASVRAFRRILYCGEWIESHALHIHLLAAPDFLGFANVIEMAKHHPQEVKRGLRLQGLGNKLIKLLGGRSVHPVGVCVGGFYKLPGLPSCETMVAELTEALPEAEQLIAWTASLALPDNTQEFESVAMYHSEEYAMNEGRIISSRGLDIGIDEYAAYFKEYQVPYSTSFHSALDGKPYLVGPLARVNLNWQQLPENVRRCISASGVEFPSKNMFHSIVARAVEIYYALLEAINQLKHIQNNTDADMSRVSIVPKAGVGYGCTEAPRGLLWHRYQMDDDGKVVSATIVPPTSQNQARIEEDLRYSLKAYGLSKTDPDLRLYAETIIRNYDPCISCSTHFLDLRVRRE